MDLKTGMQVGISCKELYTNQRESQNFEIRKQEDGDETYYDLYNNQGELACMDGETCMIVKICRGNIILRNTNGLKKYHIQPHKRRS